MRYDHKVKYNGIWYMPGEDVLEDVPNVEKQTYTKSEITTMRVDDLRQLAASMGVQDAAEMTGTELKQLLLSLLNL